jgi:hypothetical protein
VAVCVPTWALFVVKSDIKPELASIDNYVDERAVASAVGVLEIENYLAPQTSTPFPRATLTVSVKVGVY